MLPKLDSPNEFHAWFYDQVRVKRGADILQELQVEMSDLSLLRQLCVCQWVPLREERERIIELALQRNDLLLEAYAVALRCYLRIAAFDHPEDGYNAVAFSYLPMLEAYLEKLRIGESKHLSREVEAMVQVSCGLAHAYLGNTEKAAQYASQASFWADQIGAGYCASFARNLLLGIYGNSGRNVDALGILKASSSSTQRTYNNEVYQTRAYAELLFYLGHTKKPIKQLNETILKLNPAPIQGVHSALQRLGLLLGQKVDDDVYTDSTTHTWIVNSLRYLVKVQGLSRNGASLGERLRLLQSCTEICQHDRTFNLEWGKNIGKWVAATALLWQGKVLDALTEAESIKSEIHETQWFDLRTLLAGLRLELAMNFKLPEASIVAAGDELRNVFREARSVPLASPEGLAERLFYWHPLAAAYGALMPDGVFELQKGTEAILRVGSTNTAHHVSLPPALAVELSLRSMDFDSWSRINFVQADLGAARLKRSALITNRDGVSYALPVLSATKIIYGLKKAGYPEKANAVYMEYGICPNSTAEYVMLPLLERINLLTKKLLTNEINTSAYTNQILLID